MTIDKLYSKKYLSYKLVYVVLLPFLTELIAMLFDPENAIIYLFASMFFLGLFYTIPFILTLKALRFEPLSEKGECNSIGKIILRDFLYILIPAIISTILCDSIFLILDSDSQGKGIFSILVVIIILLITFVFWILYLLLKKKQ